MGKTELAELFGRISGMHVVVIGDVMLDNYWWGDVDRVSPEAPVPVVALNSRESRLGGAANVALNCRALDARVTLACIVGDDSNGTLLTTLAEEAGMDTRLILRSTKRPTTTKTRVIARNQQILRLDDETDEALSPEEEHPFLDKVLKLLQLEKPDVVIFEDYNKGLLKENVITRILAHCREIGIITAVDPKKKNFLAYKGVSIFKPNLKEIREGLQLPLETVSLERLDEADQVLRKALGHTISLITLSERGVYYNDGRQSGIIPSYVRHIADVSGAGDTVISVASLLYALSADTVLAATLSNIAGGLVCEQVGVVPVQYEQLLATGINVLYQGQS